MGLGVADARWCPVSANPVGVIFIDMCVCVCVLCRTTVPVERTRSLSPLA